MNFKMFKSKSFQVSPSVRQWPLNCYWLDGPPDIAEIRRRLTKPIHPDRKAIPCSVSTPPDTCTATQGFVQIKGGHQNFRREQQNGHKSIPHHHRSPPWLPHTFRVAYECGRRLIPKALLLLLSCMSSASIYQSAMCLSSASSFRNCEYFELLRLSCK